MVVNFQQLLNLDYLTMRYPGTISRGFFLAWLTLALVLVVGGIGMKLLPNLRKKIDFIPAWIQWWRTFGTISLTAGCFALLLLFFRYEQTPFFAARFWMIIWALATVAPLVRLVWKARRYVPEEADRYERQRRLAKYLP